MVALGRLEPTGRVIDLNALPGDRLDSATVEENAEVHKNDPLADIGTARQQPQRQPVKFTQQREGTEDHFKNLFACIRSREQPVENVEFGCGTAVACHMANLSYRAKGRRVTWDNERREVI